MRHLPWGGSTATRTKYCPGWKKASENKPRQPTSDAALEGSMLHHIKEMSMKADQHPKNFLGEVYHDESGKTLEFTEDTLELASSAFHLTNEILDEFDIDNVWIEPFVQWVPDEVGGSIDCLGLSGDGKVAIVADDKYGSKLVSIDTDQLPFYASCVTEDPKFKEYFKDVETWVFVIIQPRGAGVTKKSMSAAELEAFKKEMLAAIEFSRGDNAPMKAGEWCAFCPNAPYCEVKKKRAVEALLLDPASHNALNAAAGMVEELDEWLKAVREAIYLNVKRGVQIDGWKLVEKQARRKWKHENTVLNEAKKLGVLEDITEQKLKTPAQAEKALKGFDEADTIMGLCEKISSGTTIAPDSDKREAVTISDIPDSLANLMDKD